jgi:hypothetical protein
VNNETAVVFVFVVNEDRWIIFVLDQPASPQIANALLVSGRSNDLDRVEIDSLLDDIDRGRGLIVG